MSRCRPIAVIVCCLALIGCAEGPFWKAGHYSPWAQEKWSAEEQQADTLFERKRQLSELVAQAKNSSADAQNQAANQLKNIIHRDPVLLVKLHAISLLPDLPATASIEALHLASRDPDSRVRIAAIESWKRVNSSASVSQLQEMIGSDTDVDVRLQATRALGTFNDPSAVSALSLALTDNNPAIQLRATESLEKVTGEKLGADVAAWQTYIGNANRQSIASRDTTTIR